MGARRPLPAPPRYSVARGVGAAPRGGGEKVSFAYKKGLRRADAAQAATLLQLAVLFSFPPAVWGHERASPPGVKEGIDREARGTSAHAAERRACTLGWKFVPGPERAPAGSIGQRQRPLDRDERAESPCARGGVGAAAVRGTGARGPVRQRRQRGTWAALRDSRRVPVPHYLPLPRGPAGLQSPAASASSRAAPALGRSAVSVLPRDGGREAGPLGIRENRSGRGPGCLGFGVHCLFCRIAPSGPGRDRRSVDVEKELSGPQFPSHVPCGRRRWAFGAS